MSQGFCSNRGHKAPSFMGISYPLAPIKTQMFLYRVVGLRRRVSVCVLQKKATKGCKYNITHLCFSILCKRSRFILCLIFKADLLIQTRGPRTWTWNNSAPEVGRSSCVRGSSLTLQHGIGLQQLFLDLVHLLALPTHRCHVWHHELTGLWKSDTHTHTQNSGSGICQQVCRAHPSYHSS